MSSRQNSRRRQHSGFLNRYDFERNTPNSGGKNKRSHKQRRATNSENCTKNHQKSYRGRLQNFDQAAWEPWQEKILTNQTKKLKNTRKLAERIYHGCYTRYANSRRAFVPQKIHSGNDL